MCREKEVFMTVLPSYSVKWHYDGVEYDVKVVSLEVRQCRNCQSIGLSDAAHTTINRELRLTAGILLPEEIAAGRESLGVGQKEFADMIGVHEANVRRYESGGQIQDRATDVKIRKFVDKKR